jgi:FkbM family methyltransferase
MKSLIKSILKKSPIPFSKNHLYDLQTKRIIRHHLNDNSNCIDVGCYKGEILDLFLDRSPQGMHWAFEPIPSLFADLLRKYKNTANCTVLNYALSDQAGTAFFNYVISNPSYSGLLKREYDRPFEQDEQIQVKTELLDNLIPEDITIHLIKIDVEGAELLVLNGARKLITRSRPIIIFEHGQGASNYGETSEKVFNFFNELSMKISTMGKFLKKLDALSFKEFQDHYYSKKDYYFIAYPT